MYIENFKSNKLTITYYGWKNKLRHINPRTLPIHDGRNAACSHDYDRKNHAFIQLLKETVSWAALNLKGALITSECLPIKNTKTWKAKDIRGWWKTAFTLLRISSTGPAMFIHVLTQSRDAGTVSQLECPWRLVFVWTVGRGQVTVGAVGSVGPVSVMFVRRRSKFIFIRAALNITAVILWHLSKNMNIRLRLFLTQADFGTGCDTFQQCLLKFRPLLSEVCQTYNHWWKQAIR